MQTPIILVAAMLATAPVAATTVQQDFDAAQALLDAGKAAPARDGFAALLKRVGEASTSRSALLIRARLGEAYLRLGQPEAAVPLFEAAANGLTRPEDAAERAVALYKLGSCAETMGLIDTAAARYRAALAVNAMPADTPGGISLKAALARTLTWSAPAEAARLADELMATLARQKLQGDMKALIETLRARIDLNNGQVAAAQQRLLAAAKAAGGGDTLLVNATDMRVRGDLLIASHLLKQPADVGRYVAFSGAGYLASAQIAPPADRGLPGCAPATGLAPDAMAVVEFGIDEQGRVINTTPVFASRGSVPGAGEPDGGPESLFVQAVRGWSWPSDQVAKVAPGWRQVIRVEMRCLTSGNSFDPTMAALLEAERRWEAGQGIVPVADPAGDSDAARLQARLAELQRRENQHGADSRQLLPALRAVGWNVAAPMKTRREATARRVAILESAGAPRDVIGLAELELATFDLSWRNAAPLRLLLQRYEGWGDSRVLALLRLRLAEHRLRALDRTEASTLFDRVVATPLDILPTGDPIRTAALLRRADLSAARQDRAGAEAALAATGLTAEQCAAVGLKPVRSSGHLSFKDFPQGALRYGSGGMLAIGFDVTADGRPDNVRTVWAIPPFLFDSNTEAALRRFRYQPAFRPDGSAACTGAVETTRFRVLD